jgi:carboxyl-terminal processing protease
MTANFRALLAALIVIAVAAAGALFIGYRSGLLAARSGAIDVATTGNVGDLFNGGGNTPPQLIDLALRQLEDKYYKPVDPHVPIQGEKSALRDYLKSKKIANVTLPDAMPSDDASAESAQLANVLAFAQAHYGSALGPKGANDLTETALRGIMNSVKDPYTVYLSPREIQGLNESLSGGNFGGIGVYIYQLKDGRVIVQPIDGMPALKAGMKAGEIVDTVDGKSVSGMALDLVEKLIRGEAGSTVTLTTHPYNKPGKERSYSIVREIIHVPTVRAKMENGFDYIRLSDFGQTSAAEVRKALLDGQAKGAKGYILDLRDNGGGLLDAAVDISSFFVPEGTIVSTIDRDGHRIDQAANGKLIDGLKPLVILVNKYTASASEITSGALQDYHLATLIGTKTFGKGVVQSIYVMPDQGALKITTARYVTPLGRDIQHKGIVPDIVVPQDADPALIDTPADKQLAAAKARLTALNR